jgi:hypothetical protein
LCHMHTLKEAVVMWSVKKRVVRTQMF